jgi:hypothetical protein
MFELLINGPWTVIGTLLGLVFAFVLHRFAPSVEGSIYIEAGVVALGFVFGLLFDALREKQ